MLPPSNVNNDIHNWCELKTIFVQAELNIHRREKASQFERNDIHSLGGQKIEWSDYHKC